MSFLLRVVLPDRPGTLGAVATALGGVEADIVSVDVVERSPGLAVDDLVVELPQGRMAESLITATQTVAGVRVESIRPYAGSLDTQRELELVEAMTAEPDRAACLLVAGLPRIFRAGWCVLLRRDGDTVRIAEVSEPSPEPAGSVVEGMRVPPLATARPLDPDLDRVPGSLRALDADLTASPLGEKDVVVLLGRPGGPAFRSSEVARLAHLAGIAATIAGR